MMTTNLHCHYCVKRLDTQRQLRQHISASPACRLKWEQGLTIPNTELETLPGDPPRSPSPIFDTFDRADDNHQLYERYMFLSDGPPPSKRPRVEDQNTTVASSTRSQKPRYGETYPHVAGFTYGPGSTTFEGWMAEDGSRWEPFQSQEEWDLAKWLVRNVGRRGINELLDLDIVSNLIIMLKQTCSQVLDEIQQPIIP